MGLRLCCPHPDTLDNFTCDPVVLEAKSKRTVEPCAQQRMTYVCLPAFLVTCLHVAFARPDGHRIGGGPTAHGGVARLR